MKDVNSETLVKNSGPQDQIVFFAATDGVFS